MYEILVIDAALSEGKYPLPIGGGGILPIPPTTPPIAMLVAFLDKLSNILYG
jgi:hypothetical protein